MTMNNQNLELIDSFVQHSGLSDGTVVSYRSTLRTLSKLNEEKDLANIDLSVIEDYLMDYPNPKTYSSKLECLISFFSYVEQRHTLRFTSSILDQFRLSKSDLDGHETKEPKPLSMKEIVGLRDRATHYQEYDKLYVFEMLYAHGLTTKEMGQCCNENRYNKESRTFMIEGHNIRVNDRIANLIEQGSVLKQKDLNKTAINYRLSLLGNLIHRHITPKDVLETRKRNYLPCPSCENVVEARPENWVIVEYETDGSRWMVCKERCTPKEGFHV